MKHFNFNQSLRNLVNNCKSLFILSLALTTFGVGNAWGAWTGSGQGKNVNGVWYAAYNQSLTAEYKAFDGGAKGPQYSGSITLDAPGAAFTYVGNTSADATKNHYITPQWSTDNSNWSDGNLITVTKKSGNVSGSGIVAVNAKYFRIKRTAESTGTKDVKASSINIVMAQYIEEPSSTAEMAWGAGKVDDANVTKSITIAWCNVPALSYTVTGTGSDKVSVSIENNAEYGKYNTATVKVTYNRNAASTLDATLTIKSDYNSYSKSIKLSGSTTKYDQTLSWQNESSIETNMLNGTTQTITAISDKGQTVTYTSNNSSVLSVDTDGKLIAHAVGEATITASQNGNYKYNAATSISKTFQVKTKDTPIFTPNWSSTNIKVGDKVTLVVQYVSDGLNGNFKVKDYNSNILKVTREGNTITIEALNEDSSSVTFAQTETDAIFAASKTYSFSVSKIANTLTADATHSMKVDETWNGVISNKNSDATVTTTTTDETVAYYDVTNNKIVAQNTGSQLFTSKEVTITISQAATYKYTAAEKTITVTVEKHDNHISINGSQDSYQTSIYVDAQQAINLTATNTDYAGSPITATQTAGNTIAVLNAAQTQVTSNHNLGDATWTVSQPENYKYKAANATFTIHVVKQAEATDCYVLNDPNERSWSIISNSGNYGPFDAAGTSLLFEAKRTAIMGFSNTTEFYAEYSTDGSNWTNCLTINLGNEDQWYPLSCSIPETAKYVRFETKTKATGSKQIRNVRVTRATYLNASDFTINTQSDNTTLVYPGDIGTGSFRVDYSLANGGDLKLVCDNPKFTISKTSQSNVDCKTSSFDVDMTYTSQEAGTDYAHIVIYNNVYRKEIIVTGITQKHQQTLNWKENFDKMSKGSEEKNAASSSHGLVTYTSTNTNVIRVDNDANGYATILVAVAKGESEITATAAGDDEYDSKSISKTISVTEDHVQYIIWNQSLMGLKYELGSTKNLNAYATSEEEGDVPSSRPITYTSDNTSVVTVNGNQLTITGIGTATITARQAGGTIAGITYEAIEKTNKVVVKDPSAKCESFVYEQIGDAEEFFAMNTNEIKGTEHTLSGEPAKLTFYAKREYWKLGINYSKGNIVVDAYTSSGWQQVLDCGEPPIGSYTGYSVNLSREVTKIRFRRPSGGQGYHYIADAKIERARYIETTTPPVFQANVGEVQEHKINLNYSNITSDLLLSIAGGATSHFSVDKTTIEGDCGDAKKNIELTISYAPTKDTEGNVDGKEQETLNITDGTTVYQVALYGKASKVDQHIVWDINDENNVYTIEQVTLTATTETNLHQAAGELAYHTVGATTAGCATIDNNILSFSKNGIVYVEAYTIASSKYNPATSVTKSWTVSKTPTTVTTKPTISGDIISGTSIASLTLNGGATQNTVNNQAVEGTFAITGGNLVNVGQQTLTITFTPNNTDMYEGCTTTITVNVVQREATAEEVGTPSAASITYGNAINTSVLSGNGTLAGTWTWVDEDANKATPNVGTVDNLNVIFTPNDGNVNPVAATVSLIVTKANAQLTWMTAPANVEISETVTYLATSNHSESAITYSIISGNEYATIDATTGALSMLSAGTITVQAAQAATTNYNAATITTTTTITGQLENKFTNAAGDNDWQNEENWTNGVPTEENPNVIIAGEVTIDEPISVGGLTIEEEGKVTVVDNGNLSVNGTSDSRETYGNLFIKNGGDVTIATSGNVRVHDFVIESSIGTSGTSQSGQITNANKVLYVNGAYIDINLDPTGKANDTQWYGFTVPFPVDVHNGVARKEGDTFRKLTYGTDYMFAEYDMNQRLNSGKGWKYITTSQLQPGRFYYITFNGDYNTYSFKAATNTITTSYTTDLTTNGTGANANWNAVGNSALRHVTASYGTTDDETFVQVYQNGLSQYMTVRTNDATFVVGCPFFVQAKEKSILQLTDATTDHANSTYAPLRKVTKANRSIKLVIAPENGGYSDQVYMRTTTDVKSEYIIGRDLAKAGVGTASVQMWINAYGQKLSVNETEIIGEEAIFPLGIYAPKAGGYRLTIDETDTPTYLMENGVVIWDFANGSYVVDLSKGTNNDYSIVRTAPNAPGEATNIYSTEQNNQSINKVIFRNKMYIINNAHTYDAQGQTIR